MREGALRKIFAEFGGGLATAAFFLCVLVALWRGLDGAKLAGDEERLRLTETALRRAVVSYYALEGCYPATLSDLTGSYPLAIDDGLYVDYRIFASNIMPEITVLEVSP
ncbi:MAG TPA: hypothetical protein VN446_03900 [Candidatus Acidoferrum sp.]|nr:hypothetical protein [Candidatus Acidoferrum sp.]